MKTKLISIGNSKGIRIPKVVLSECNIENDVELEVEKDRIVIKPFRRKPRQGWDEAFKLMHERGEDAPVVDETIDLDMEDWEVFRISIRRRPRVRDSLFE